MADGHDLWSILGIKPQDAVSGFAGGIVAAFVYPKAGIMPAVAAVVVGTLTATYVGPVFSQYIHKDLGSAASFLVGVCAMTIVKSMSDRVAKSISSVAKQEED